MAQSRQGRRGSYAKGVAKREEILERALEVIAREGYRGASVKVLADAVGLSQAGLLHYFDSKEELFTEIVRKRDEVDIANYRPSPDGDREVVLRDGYVEIIRHNSDVPGLVELYSRMAVDAVDPQHPAHRFFLERGRQLRAVFAEELASSLEARGLSGEVESETLARILQAVADGLQLQWMLEPEIDMAAIVAQLFDLLFPDATDRNTDDRT
jgi:AcrR family transcriptional regulator